MGGWFFDSALSWLTSVLLGAVDTVWKTLDRFAFTNPDATAVSQVRMVSSRCLAVVDVVYVLAVLVAAIVVMVHDSVNVRYGLADLAPRLVIGLVAAHLADPLCRGLVTTTNALGQALTDDAATSPQSLATLHRVLVVDLTAQVYPSPQAALMGLAAALILVLSLSLLLGWIARIGLLVVLTAIAPLALACHALPYTEPAARLWWRSMLAVLLVATAQAFALHVTLAVFLAPQADYAALGLPGDASVPLRLVVVACLLWLTTRIPAQARRYATGSRANPVASALRVVVAVRGARSLVNLVR